MWIDQLQRPLRVGITQIPNQILKTKEGYIGFSMDLFKKIESFLGIEFEYIYYETWDDLIIAGKERKIDIIFAAQKSEHRLKDYDFTDPILKQKNKILITGSQTQELKIKDLFGKRLAVVEGSAVYEYLELNYPKLNLKATKNEYEALRLTVDGDVDCAISEVVRASYYMKKIKKEVNLYVAGDIGYDYNLRIASRNDMPILNLILSKSVESLPAAYMESLALKWGYIQEVDNRLLKRVMLGSFILVVFIALWGILLRRENRQLQEVLDSSIAAMALFKNDRTIYLNRILLKRFGYENKDLLGKELKFFLESSHEVNLEKILQHSNQVYSCQFRTKGGVLVPILLKGTPLKGRRYILSFIDIGEIKKAQEELEELNRTLEQKVIEGIEKNRKHERMLSEQARLAQMGEAINMIAHQWRQPLSNINGVVMLMDMRLAKEYPLALKLIATELNEIEKLCMYMSQTINDFRDFFNPLKEKVNFSIRESIEGSLNLIYPALLFEKIQLTKEYGDEIRYLGYSNELGQVILNILNNAKDAFVGNTQVEEKKIHIALFKKYDRAIITIEDNAGGIDESIIEDIFEPYFSTKAKSKGTGLGLYISRIIIEEHMRGRLHVRNGDKGAIFSIELDLV